MALGPVGVRRREEVSESRLIHPKTSAGAARLEPVHRDPLANLPGGNVVGRGGLDVGPSTMGRRCAGSHVYLLLRAEVLRGRLAREQLRERHERNVPGRRALELPTLAELVPWLHDQVR